MSNGSQKDSPSAAASCRTSAAQGQETAPKGADGKPRAHGTGSGGKPARMPITAQNAALAAQQWKEEHPDAYGLLAETCLDLRRRNVRCSMRYAIEKVRVMDYPSEHRRPEIPFKIHNTMSPALARMLMHDYPELEGAFETRRSLSDGEV